MCVTIYLDPEKQSVIERFSLLGGVCYRRFRHIYYITHTFPYSLAPDQNGAWLYSVFHENRFP